jgi:hypothetical protein
MPDDNCRQRRQHGRATRVAVNVQRTPTRVVGVIVRHVVVVNVVAMTVMAMVPMVMAALIAVVHVVIVAVRVGVNENVRRHTGRRPMGRADDGRQCEQHRHRPDQGNAASARSLQSRQHAVR